jgi:hypothetical protein
MVRRKTMKYRYQGRDTHIDNWFTGFIGLAFYESDTDEYGITKAFTFTLLGNNFNFAKEI